MNILLLSFSDINYDGRLRELKKVCQEIGETISVVRVNDSSTKDDISTSRDGIGGLISFIKESIRICRLKKIDIIFLDNRMSCIPGLILRKKYPDILFIQDVRELYIVKEQKSLKSKIGSIIEKRMACLSDIIIAANMFRAKYMYEHWNIDEIPFSYENYRKLIYRRDYILEGLTKKYEYLTSDSRKKVISTAGTDVKRKTDELVRQLGNMDNCLLMLVGGGSDADSNKIKSIIQEESIKNVFLIDKVEESELKYLINISDIGVVNYGQYDTNNNYCASGKIYEFLYEGKPVITTENPPLAEMCEKYEIGVANNNFFDGLNQVLSNYDYYKKKVFEYTNSHSVEENNELLVDYLKGKIKVLS